MSVIVFFIIFNYRRSVYCWKNFNMKQVYKVKSENLHLLPKIFWWGRGNTTTVRDCHLKKERFMMMADTGLTLQTPWYENGNVLFLQPLRVGASVLLNNFFPSITPHLFPQSWAHSCGLTKPRSPPGSPVPGIPQARTLEWVAISFSNAWKWKVKGKSLSCVLLPATPWTTAYQVPLSMGFSRQEYQSGVPLPSPLLRWFLSSMVVGGGFI